MSDMHIAIVGAGFAGLSAAKILKSFGHEVTVFELADDVGGVWSASRRYPGVTTQNNRSTYGLSDFPMPKDFPEWPSGEQVQRYLADYADHFGVTPHLRLGTEVVAAELDEPAGRWTLTTAEAATGSVDTERFDHLVIANGIFCTPNLPDYAGAEEFTAAGGRLCHATELTDLEELRDREVVVVGYGKSSCDVARAASDVATSTTVIARDLLWKMPKKIGGALNFKYLMLTRMGEALFRHIEPVGFERVLHGPAKPVRNAMLRSVQQVTARQLRLGPLGLVPHGSFERIARSTVSLTTDGFYERVRDGRIEVRRDTSIARLLAVDGRPSAELSDGSVVPADAVLCGTGYRQSVPFLSADLQERVTDDRGNFELYRQIQPLDVPHLSFSGYNSSFFSPLSAEIAALWIAARLRGDLALPPLEQQRAHIATRLRWMEERTEGKHARGTNIIPFSMHNIDEMLSDIGIDVGPVTRAKQWLLPIDPGDYVKVTTELLARPRDQALTAA